MATIILTVLGICLILFSMHVVISGLKEKDNTELSFGLTFSIVGSVCILLAIGMHYQEDRRDFCNDNIMLSEYTVKKTTALDYIKSDTYNCSVTYYNKDLIKKDTSVTMIVTPNGYKIK